MSVPRWLPLLAAGGINARAPQEPRNSDRLGDVLSSPRVLLIDPSDGARRTLAERLHLQGFSVTECRDGAEGAVLALEDPPAAVIADLSMPSISGVQLC
ncbi:MAG TPA: response regulator, partial [Polyangiales bacterium]|nr:response regulator [Polyangiales bacterium]